MRSQALVLIAALLAGCHSEPKSITADDPPPENAADCRLGGGASNRANCTIIVRARPDGRGCKVDVADPLARDVVFRLGERNLWVVWRLDADSSGFRFPSNGIEFKLDVDPLRNFSPGRPFGPRERFYAVRNRNSMLNSAGEYKYVIRVENPATGARCELDPRIVNRR
jgi:hypothetical protein